MSRYNFKRPVISELASLLASDGFGPRCLGQDSVSMDGRHSDPRQIQSFSSDRPHDWEQYLSRGVGVRQSRCKML